MAYPNLADHKSNKKKITVPQKSLIRGKFPAQVSIYPKPRILRVNSILFVALAAAVMFSMISYLAVTAKESSVKELHFSTNKINYENIELQNRVDYLKSFYAIDDKVQKIDFLKKADKVMEVEEKNSIPVFLDNRSFFNVTSVPGY